MLSEYGITALDNFTYKHASFRHLRRSFVLHVRIQWTDEELERVNMELAQRVYAWLTRQDLSLYDSVGMSKQMSFERVDREWTAITCEVDLYGRIDED
jgi:hypothetical protein